MRSRALGTCYGGASRWAGRYSALSFAVERRVDGNEPTAHTVQSYGFCLHESFLSEETIGSADFFAKYPKRLSLPKGQLSKYPNGFIHPLNMLLFRFPPRLTVFPRSF